MPSTYIYYVLEFERCVLVSSMLSLFDESLSEEEVEQEQEPEEEEVAEPPPPPRTLCLSVEYLVTLLH